ncbi:ComEC/Rec2 family competence protein [Patescibacteria group bacterium]
MKTTKQSFFIFLALLICFLPFAVFLSWPQNKISFIACNVGQGDAIFITKGFTQILIDGGPNAKVLDCLSENMPFWDREIELIVNTHPDADHITGLIDVIERYSVKMLLSNSMNIDEATFQAFLKLTKNKNIPVYSPQKGDKLKVGEISIDVLWPSEKVGKLAMWQQNQKDQVLGEKVYKGETNIKSLVLQIKHKSFDAVLTGDIGFNEEKEIIKNNTFSGIEILKIAHHGSKYSTSIEFLKAVDPDIAVISVGKNPWGHPTQDVLQKLKKENIKVLRTDTDEINISYE